MYMAQEDKDEMQEFLPSELREAPESSSQEESDEEESDEEESDEEESDEGSGAWEEDAHDDGTGKAKSKKEQMPGAAQEFLNTRLLETGMLFAGSAKGERSGIYKAKKDVEDDTFDDV